MIVIWAVLVYLIGAIGLAYMTYKVYTSNPSNEVNMYFSLLGVSSFIWVVSEVFYWSTDGMITLVFYHLKYVGIIFVPYSALLVSQSVPIKRKILKIKNIQYYLLIPQILSVIFLVTNPLHHLFFTKYRLSYAPGEKYVGCWGPYMWFVHIPVSYIYVMASIITILLSMSQSRLKVEKNISLYLYVGILVPILTNAISVAIDIAPDPTPAAVSISGIIMLSALVRYKVFSFEFSPEAEVTEIVALRSGINYIVKDRIVGYKAFRELASRQPGIVVSHRIPLWVRVNFDILHSPVIWLTETEHKYGINPERMEFEIMYSLTEFLRQNPSGVILVDGIYYLTLYHGFDKTFKFLKDVGDLCSSYGATYIVVNPEGEFFEESEQETLRNIFDEYVDKVMEEDLSEKSIYLLYSKARDRMLRALEIKERNLFFISTKNPHKFGIKDGLWLTNVGKGIPIEQLPFQGIERISEEVRKGRHIVFDGFEVLYSYFDENDVLKMLKYISDLCAKNDLLFIMVTSEDSLPQKSKAFLEDLADEIVVYEEE